MTTAQNLVYHCQFMVLSQIYSFQHGNIYLLNPDYVKTLGLIQKRRVIYEAVYLPDSLLCDCIESLTIIF